MKGPPPGLSTLRISWRHCTGLATEQRTKVITWKTSNKYEDIRIQFNICLWRFKKKDNFVVIYKNLPHSLHLSPLSQQLPGPLQNPGTSKAQHRYQNCKTICFIAFYSVTSVTVFLASQDALEVMRVTDLLTESALALTLLMWPWWVMIPIEDYTDVILMTPMTLTKVI